MLTQHLLLLLLAGIAADKSLPPAECQQQQLLRTLRAATDQAGAEAEAILAELAEDAPALEAMLAERAEDAPELADYYDGA